MVNELYRQGVHVGVGLIALITALVLPQKGFLILWTLVTLAYVFVISVAAGTIKWLFIHLERERVPFKGKGGLFYFLGILITAALFWNDIVLALLLLAIPDALATALAPLIRSPPLPYNKRKSTWGSAVFFISASLILSVWFQQLAIFFIAFLLTALESFDYHEIPFLDDNLVIPVVAGFLLQFL
jgi:dolichol kinase